MRITFKTLRWKNFLSTGNVFTELNLDQHSNSLVVGTNGAGKSTLMNIASGTLQPDGGEISIHGETIKNLSPKHATELGLTIVHQHPAVLPDLTIAENILISVDEKYLKGDGKSVFENIEKILIEFGLAVNLRDRVETLTVAQQHLLDLAKAFAVNPSILILDEPTVGLDPILRKQLWQIFKELNKKGKTLLISSHVMDEAENCDHIFMIRDGKIIASGNTSELKSRTGLGNMEDVFISLVKS